MKKVFILLIAASGGAGLMAQSNVELDSVLVSASRFETSFKTSNRNVIVISKEEIQNAPVAGISDLLDFAIGIDARQRGTLGTQTDLSIRGGTFEQVLVLLNGVRLSDPQTGHHLMNLPVQKEDIERVEVLLGGGSYLFGSSAFSGAVNIITKKDRGNALGLSAEIGSHDSYAVGVSQNLSGKSHNTFLSFNGTSSKGFKTNTDFDVRNIFAQTDIEINESMLNISGGYNWQQFGAQNFYSTAFPEQYEKTKTLFANIGLKSGDKIKVDRQLYWRRNWDEFQLYREGPGFYQYKDGVFISDNDTAASFYSKHNYHRTDVAGAKLEVKFNGKLGKTAMALEYRIEKIISNNLGDSLITPIEMDKGRGIYYLGKDRQNLSFAVEQSKTLGSWNISAALLANYNSAYHTDLYPAATVGYALNKKQRLYSSFNRSFRLPSYTDLYYRLGGAVGSSELKPENSINYELGYKFFNKYLFANISAFRREGKNIIDWVKSCDSCELKATNTSEVNFNGVDLNLKIGNFAIMKTLRMDYLQLGYSHLFTDNVQLPYQSLYVFDYLTDKVTLSARHSIINDLILSYAVSYQNRNGQYMDAVSGMAADYPDIVLVNARLAYNWKKTGIYISAQNLLNKRYFDRGNVELPGLWVWTGLNIRL